MLEVLRLQGKHGQWESGDVAALVDRFDGGCSAAWWCGGTVRGGGGWTPRGVAARLIHSDLQALRIITTTGIVLAASALSLESCLGTETVY